MLFNQTSQAMLFNHTAKTSKAMLFNQTSQAMLFN